MSAFAHLPFILVGDSGEQDPEIYREVVRDFPGRIASIYIRSVSAGAARCAEIGRIAEDVRSAGSNLILVTDSETAAIHETRAGRINRARLELVRLDEEIEKLCRHLSVERYADHRVHRRSDARCHLQPRGARQ